MQAVYYCNAMELAKAEQRVALFSALVELQRLLIEHLDLAGDDITSAKIVLDDLLANLAVSIRRRYQLRTNVDALINAA